MAFSLVLGSVSFLLAVIWGRPLIDLLRERGIGKQIRIEGPSSHQVKIGTPTMGGWLIVIPVVLITGLLNLFNFIGLKLIGRSILVPMAVMLTYGIVGAVDDLQGVRGPRKGLGMSARAKFLWQVGLAAVFAVLMYYGLRVSKVGVPGIPYMIDLGIWFVPIAMFVIVGASNAVNLTDGLDGLAGSVVAVAYVAYGVVAYLQGQVYLVQFAFTVVGALFAFLWYNAYPAELFMGDTGSLALGATLGVVALMTGQWLLLPVVALIPVAEALSVMAQVGYFKLTRRLFGEGRRLLKMAPLHHHFELLGWSETQVTQRFWLVSILAGMVGIALALI